MAKRGKYASKYIQGENLSEAEREYNKAVSRAIRRSKTFEKRGVVVDIPSAPKFLDSQAINRIEGIRWANRENVNQTPMRGDEELDQWFTDLISDVTDYQQDVELANSISRKAENNARRWRLAEKYAGMISNLLTSIWNKWGARGIYRILMTAGRYSDLISLCHMIYQVYNIAEQGRNERSMYFERIATILNNNIPLSDQQYADISETGIADFDYEEEDEE